MGNLKKVNIRLTYLKSLKNEIQSFQINFKKRIHNFPWDKINKIPKNKIFSSMVIDVRGSKFTIFSLVKEISKIKKSLENKVKNGAFNSYIRSYLKDSARVKEKDVKSIYNTYSNELKKEFKFCFDDLSFCAEALNQINKAIRNEYKDVKESAMADLDIELKEKREDIINKAIKAFEDLGISPKIAKSDKEKFIDSGSTSFKNSLCFAGLGNENLNKNCSEINKVIKPLGGSISPDNYGTAFLKVKNEFNESEEIIMNNAFFDSDDLYFESEEDEKLYGRLLLEALVADIEEEQEYDVYTTEGTNLQVRAMFKKSKKAYKELLKRAKSARKHGNYKEAKKYLNSAIGILSQTKKAVDTMDSTIMSDVIGWFTAFTLTFGRDMVTALIPFAGGAILEVRALLEMIARIVNAAKRGGDATEILARYKNQVSLLIDDYIKKCKLMINAIETDEKMEKRIGIKESHDELIEAKVALYESCEAGEISIAERNELLYELDLAEESADDDYEDDEVTVHSPYEKFESVKSILYKQCQDGEITVSEREELINKAYQMIIESDGVSDDLKDVEAEANKDMEKESKNLKKEVEKRNLQSNEN